MIENNPALEQECTELLTYLYTTAAFKCRDTADVDSLVADSMFAYLVKRERGEVVTHPKAFLDRVLVNKYNDELRCRYRNRMVSYEEMTWMDRAEPQETGENDEEYAMVRRALSRLTALYREVAVRHYVRGEGVNEIAAALGIPRGTVLSRLSDARGQIKEDMINMEQYSQYSYAPRRVTIGIRGSAGLRGEPFSLISTPIEQNALILAYETPVSVRGMADAMGIPCAYLEPVIDRLVTGELMGRTPGGLVYTRCYMERHEDAFGDIEAQEAFAAKHASEVWRILWELFEPLTERDSIREMNEKQRATLVLYFLQGALRTCIAKSRPRHEAEVNELPERPNGGRWYATATIHEGGQRKIGKYDTSGPLHTQYRTEDGKYNRCQMFDLQSVLGDTQWGYLRMKYRVEQGSIMRFLASFLPCDVRTDNSMLYDLIPDFEALHILRREADGTVALDIPALSYEEIDLWNRFSVTLTERLYRLLGAGLTRIWQGRKNHVPRHVDNAARYRHAGALDAYVVAQLLAVVEGGYMPYHVEIGKTPILYIAYRRTRDAGETSS